MMWRTEKSAERPGFDLSGYPISSDGELDYRHNDLGRLGEQIGAFRTRTATVAASAGVTFELTPRLDLQTSVAFGRGYRQIIDRFEPTIRPTLRVGGPPPGRSEEHTSELQSLMRISYAVFCLKKTTNTQHSCKHT